MLRESLGASLHCHCDTVTVISRNSLLFVSLVPSDLNLGAWLICLFHSPPQLLLFLKKKKKGKEERKETQTSDSVDFCRYVIKEFM